MAAQTRSPTHGARAAPCIVSPPFKAGGQRYVVCSRPEMISSHRLPGRALLRALLGWAPSCARPEVQAGGGPSPRRPADRREVQTKVKVQSLIYMPSIPLG